MVLRIAVLSLVLATAIVWLATALPGLTIRLPETTAAAAAPAAAPPAAAPVAAPETPRPPGGRVVEILRDSSGHFVVDADVDGRHVEFVVDTGASYIALDQNTARRLNLRPAASDYTVRVNTASGPTMVAPVKLEEVRIGRITVRDVWALVHAESDLSLNLLGMNFLSELRSFEIRGNRLVLSQ